MAEFYQQMEADFFQKMEADFYQQMEAVSGVDLYQQFEAGQLVFELLRSLTLELAQVHSNLDLALV